jgi:hypothetical protein
VFGEERVEDVEEAVAVVGWEFVGLGELFDEAGVFDV